MFQPPFPTLDILVHVSAAISHFRHFAAEVVESRTDTCMKDGGWKHLEVGGDCRLPVSLRIALCSTGIFSGCSKARGIPDCDRILAIIVLGDVHERSSGDCWLCVVYGVLFYSVSLISVRKRDRLIAVEILHPGYILLFVPN